MCQMEGCIMFCHRHIPALGACPSRLVGSGHRCDTRERTAGSHAWRLAMTEMEWNKERAAHELEVRREQHQRIRDYMIMGVLSLLVIVTILLFFMPAVDNPQRVGQITPETQAWA